MRRASSISRRAEKVPRLRRDSAGSKKMSSLISVYWKAVYPLPTMVRNNSARKARLRVMATTPYILNRRSAR